jgi:hypothetical protein
MTIIKCLKCHTLMEAIKDLEIGKEYRIIKEDENRYTIRIGTIENNKTSYHDTHFTKKPDSYGRSYKDWFEVIEYKI